MNILWLGLERSLGIESKHNVLIMNKGTFSTEKIEGFYPDILIEREFNDGISEYKAEIDWVKRAFPKCKTAVWLIDTHVKKDYHINYSKNFEYKFVAIKKYKEELGALWLPLSFPGTTVPQYKMDRKHKIGFVGRFNCRWMEDRTDFLNKIKDTFGRKCHFVTDYKDVYKTMSECFIMLNKSIVDDLNFRVFEAMACGNILITNSVPDIYEIDGLREHVYVYNSVGGAKEMIHDILHSCDESPEYYKRKSDEAVEFVKSSHTLPHRIESMLQMIDSKVQVNF